MIFSESYFATAPFSRKRPEPSTASTLPASGCGERLVPHFDHLELRGPAFGFKAVALGSHGALLGAPLCGLGHIRDILKERARARKAAAQKAATAPTDATDDSEEQKYGNIPAEDTKAPI